VVRLKRLTDIIDVLAKKEYARAAQLASEFDKSSIQHIVDEENVDYLCRMSSLNVCFCSYRDIRINNQHRTSKSEGLVVGSRTS
jgi:hypothetical protein